MIISRPRIFTPTTVAVTAMCLVCTTLMMCCKINLIPAIMANIFQGVFSSTAFSKNNYKAAERMFGISSNRPWEPLSEQRCSNFWPEFIFC